ncbi:MAG TPA: hypothetical protein VGK74_08570 [Symbiobacteriaceae bacterium]|jgi:hypothetical protein
MLRIRTAGAVLLVAVFLAACARPVDRPVTPAAEDKPLPSSATPAEKDDRTPPVSTSRQVQAKFYLLDASSGFKDPGRVRELTSGKSVIGPATAYLEVVPANPGDKLTLRLDGAPLVGEIQWSATSKSYILRAGPGKPDDKVTITVERAGVAPAVLSVMRVAPATVTVDQANGESWKPVTVLDSSTQPGPGQVRLLFSKPVHRQEVEQSLVEAQPMPIRGLMTWENDKTLIWQIGQLPPRLDFFLDGAHDQDGLPLPGGIPSLRVGSPPNLVLVNVAEAVDQPVAPLPPDVISARLSPDGKYVNLTAWTPGASRWDWRTADLYVDLAAKSLKSGRVDDIQPRIPGDWSSWAVNPPGTTVAGLRSAKSGTSGKVDLVVTDLRGGRSQVYPDFLDQEAAPGNGDNTRYLAWSADGRQVAAISYKGGKAGADVVALDLPTGRRTTLVQNLPVASGAASLSWSPDGRYLQVGNLLLELRSGAVRTLEGDAGARGIWEPGGTRLLYNERDWGPVYLIDPAAGGGTKPLGIGMIVSWAGPDKAYVIRWGASNARYVPPGF